MLTVDRTEWSTIYAALANSDRRDLLRYLKTVQVTQIEDVVQQLLKRESGSAEEESDAMMIKLYHKHLPKVEEAGLLTWNSQQNQITLTALGSQLPAELIDPCLEPSPTAGDRDVALD
ncbi:DUF7344 domain-containing protein [Halorubrum sp. N11]|uniref:DUF7344 domain-containing protein n=1 Tax=Halorubrum sp. N11 TaxID=3402276 RepID=UPI003EBE587B